MYFNPSWSHAQSAFAVALFFWYWDRTRADRSWTQWLVLGLISGLMMDVYYVCAVLLVVPLIESLVRYWQDFSSRQMSSVWRLFLLNVLFTLAALCFPPHADREENHLRQLFGIWLRPALGLHVACLAESVFFFRARPFQLDAGNSACGDWPVSSEKSRSRAELVLPSGVLLFDLYAIGCYEDWAGISSFGNRFFVSLTPLFILGLAVFFDWLSEVLQERRAEILSAALTTVLIIWNLGLVFQWGTHLIPARGPISWHDAAYNQVAVVPVQAARTLESYLTGRKQMMRRIERQDLERLKSTQPADPEPTQ